MKIITKKDFLKLTDIEKIQVLKRIILKEIEYREK